LSSSVLYSIEVFRKNRKARENKLQQATMTARTVASSLNALSQQSELYSFSVDEVNVLRGVKGSLGG
jgi:hypothetical protein